MFLVRDIMYCKPGQVRPMVQKFPALSKLGQQMGMGTMRVMTDVLRRTLLDRRRRDGSQKHRGACRDGAQIDGRPAHSRKR